MERGERLREGGRPSSEMERGRLREGERDWREGQRLRNGERRETEITSGRD